MTNLIPALFRTGVPIIYAILIKLGVSRLGLPDAVVTDVAAVVLALALYLILRLLEAVEPRLGVLLGWIGQPQYAGKVDSQVDDWENAVISAVHPALEKVKADILDAIEAKIQAEVATATKTISKTVTTATKKTAAKSAAKTSKA